MMRLGGQATAAAEGQTDRVSKMLLELARWVDRDGNGKINYLEFISAFRPATPSQVAKPPAPMEHLLEHLCALFYRHRWTLQHAFEFFDKNGDGVLTPEEFTSALNALSTLSIEEDGSAEPTLPLSSDQINMIVSAIDRNGDGVIDYEEFLLALQAHDTMQR